MGSIPGEGTEIQHSMAKKKVLNKWFLEQHWINAEPETKTTSTCKDQQS